MHAVTYQMQNSFVVLMITSVHTVLHCYQFSRPSQMAARGPNPARKPYLFGPLPTPIYIKIHRTMVNIWPSDIYLWTLFGPLWPARKNNWEPLVYNDRYDDNQHLYSAFCQKIQSAAAYYYGIRKIVTVILLHLGVLLAKCTPYQHLDCNMWPNAS